MFFFHSFINQVRQDFDQHRHCGSNEDLCQKQQEQVLIGRQIAVFVGIDTCLSDHDMVEQKVGVTVCRQHIDHFHKMGHFLKQSFQSQKDEEGSHGQDHDGWCHIDGEFCRIKQIESQQCHTDRSGPFGDAVHHLYQKHAQDEVVDLDREIVVGRNLCPGHILVGGQSDDVVYGRDDQCEVTVFHNALAQQWEHDVHRDETPEEPLSKHQGEGRNIKDGKVAVHTEQCKDKAQRRGLDTGQALKIDRKLKADQEQVNGIYNVGDIERDQDPQKTSLVKVFYGKIGFLFAGHHQAAAGEHQEQAHTDGGKVHIHIGIHRFDGIFLSDPLQVQCHQRMVIHYAHK